jgi:hypothetical protein
VRVNKTLTWGWSGFAAAFGVLLLPQTACALANAPVGPGEPQNGLTPGQAYSPRFALAPGFAPAIGNLWAPNSAWDSPGAVSAYRSIADAGAFSEDPGSPSFDTGGYDPMWDDTRFSELAAYGGLERDALRVAGMRAIDGSDGASGALPYGQLTVQRDLLAGQHQLTLGAYGTQASVRPSAIAGLGADSYMDVAVDGTWRWFAHPENSISNMISAHVLVLREDESLVASHAIFGTRSADDLTVFRGDASWSWGGSISPTVQYFRITGSSDPARLGTLDGSPDSRGCIAEIDYQPSDNARLPLERFNVRLSLQFVAYSEFDGSSRDSSHNNTVLLHLSASTDPGP